MCIRDRLNAGIGGEVGAHVALVQALELEYQSLHIVLVQLGVHLDTLFSLHLVDDLFELRLGQLLNDEVVEGLAAKTGNPRFAYDSYRRFVQMFSDVVMELPKSCLLYTSRCV